MGRRRKKSGGGVSGGRGHLVSEGPCEVTCELRTAGWGVGHVGTGPGKGVLVLGSQAGLGGV